MVKLWDVETGQEALVLRGHTSAGIDMAFSPDGTRLATADKDCKLNLWAKCRGFLGPRYFVQVLAV